MRVLNGALLYRAIEGGARYLDQHKDAVDALNVFPVPDGDTGTNMTLTLQAACREVEGLANLPVVPAGEIAAAVAQGSLMGARGNSGVILSQLFRGFARHLAGREAVEAGEVAMALREGVKAAYQAVMRPVEGTILTVAREAAHAAVARGRDGGGLLEILEEAHRRAREALARTPLQLPVLRQAGVVDAGGQGLVYFLEGMLLALQDHHVPGPYTHDPVAQPIVTPPAVAQSRLTPTTVAQPTVTQPTVIQPGAASPAVAPPPAVMQGAVTGSEPWSITFPYDTVVVVRGEGLSPDKIRNQLARHGDSLLVVGSPEVIKVHIHTGDPGGVLSYCSGLGEILEAHVENMPEQHRRWAATRQEGEAPTKGFPRPVGGISDSEVAGPVENHQGVTGQEGVRREGVCREGLGEEGAGETGIVAVSPGEGLSEIFRSLGAGVVVPGGQSMNPSIEELLQAIQDTGARRVIILPNNANVILAARQAAELVAQEEPRGAVKEVLVIPTRSIPQGLAALLAWQPQAPVDTALRNMERAMAAVRTGEITYAVRPATLGDRALEPGDILGLGDGDIKVVGKEPCEALVRLVAELAGPGTEVITVFYGSEVTPGEAGALAEELQRRYPDHEVELRYGGQPLYYYILSVE